MEAITLNGVSKDFGSGTSYVKVLHDINFKAQTGEVDLVIGPSGSGKSTFLTIAGGLQSPSSGEVLINGSPFTSETRRQQEAIRLSKIGFVLQTYSLVPYLTVQDQFKLVDIFVKKNHIEKERFNQILKDLQIDNLMTKYPSQLSGGQNQRVAIARAIYPDPEIILADEPTAALDTARVKEVGKIMANFAHEKGKAIVIVTHDQRLSEFADHQYEILDGRMRPV
ncbi:ABC transporter ATP-binding protein [Secundilactobacillus folii]|uniref:Putative hemin import ATP-binding protein HrtA n=1 Tax=Secundilactobacillus folii TaxID=2678357 RepID=A0A7X3C2P7_9LACO|nr:ABC transporter ATP-binding protein [Secundilactobacillus folii]MTV81766.1 ATP-binding cassette domain-containing protein [Secundilactobacillus folii]